MCKIAVLPLIELLFEIKLGFDGTNWLRIYFQLNCLYCLLSSNSFLGWLNVFTKCILYYWNVICGDSFRFTIIQCGAMSKMLSRYLTIANITYAFGYATIVFSFVALIFSFTQTVASQIFFVLRWVIVLTLIMMVMVPKCCRPSLSI